MNSASILRVAMLAVLFIGLLTAVQPLQAATCSNASLKGDYGILVTGTAAGNPIATMGKITADGNGALTGSETFSVNGTLFDTVTVSGTYTVGATCSGKATITPQGGTATTYNLAILANGKVQLVGADSGTVESGLLRTQGTNLCSPLLVKGTYGIAQSGDVVGQGPLAFGGQIRIRANGLLSGVRWGSSNGVISSGDAISGVYKVDKTCYGGAVLNINDDSGIFYNIQVVDGGNTILFLETNPGTVSAGVWER